MSSEAKPFLVIMGIVILMACVTAPFPVKNHLVELSDGKFAVQRCRGFLPAHCRLYNISDTRAEAFKEFESWEKMDHPDAPPTVIKVIL